VLTLDVDSITLAEAAEAERMAGPYDATLMGADLRAPRARALIALLYIACRRALPDEPPAETLGGVLAAPLMAIALTLTGASLSGVPPLAGSDEGV
jgi:hypothetical protein